MGCAKILISEAIAGNTPAKILNKEKRDLQIRWSISFATACSGHLGPNPAFYTLRGIERKDCPMAPGLLLPHCIVLFRAIGERI